MMSIIFVIMVFSGGMPILYIIGFIYFLSTYITNKLLILKYYIRTRTMNRSIPFYSIKLLKWGLIIHIIGAAFMLTNPEPFKVEETVYLSHFNVVKDISSFKNFNDDTEKHPLLKRLMMRF